MLEGDILLNDGAHVATNLTNGAKASGGGASQTVPINSNVKLETAKGFNKSLAGTYKVTGAGALNLRSGAGTGKDKKVLTTMQSGETCQCYGYYTDVSGVKWLYVAYKNVVGFASSKISQKVAEEGENMLYYLGKGTEFKKEDCKEYKTIEGALKAAAKNEELVVWDENGNVIGSLTDNVPEGALETNPDGSVNTYNADGNKVGTMTAEELKAATTLTDEKDAEGQQGDAGASTDDENGGTGGNAPVEPENGQNGANSEQENGQQTSGDGDDAAGQETSGDDERKQRNRCPILTQSIRKRPQERSLIVMVL